ncbi:hypothetical protein [Psychrobacter sp. TB55-MNA-CIBAN-0194]|uniref:hypothetical protein n=1 Tax=Psychrobacter sp. TB55-MNA-CIBAN-0194 TaxID=3140445 RepID=UPI003322E14C
MSFFYPKDVDFMEMFGCESHIDSNGLLESTFTDTQNQKMVFSISDMQNSISAYVYQDEALIFKIYEEGAMRVKIYENQIIIEYLNYQDLYAKRLTIIDVYPIFKIDHSTLIDKDMSQLN